MKRKKKALQRQKKELKEQQEAQDKEEGKSGKQEKTHNYSHNHKVSSSGSVFSAKGKSGIRRTP